MGRILVVEREPRTVSLLRRSLIEQGHLLETTGEATRAVDLVSSNAYDLLLLVLPLVGCDGVDVLRRIMVVRPEQQVLVLSGSSGVDEKVRCFDLGAVDYVTLPCSLAELLARTRRRLVDVSNERVLRAGAVTLDLQRRAADVGSDSIPLTGREFQLLRHLMTQQDEVCTRFELLSEVWGYSFDPGTNVVDQCVRRLRAKLGNDLIETIRNVGYSFQAM
jgi:DNA-binding response OmpR family regulator